jgi:ABC-type sugar transport system permease subunit
MMAIIMMSMAVVGATIITMAITMTATTTTIIPENILGVLLKKPRGRSLFRAVFFAIYQCDQALRTIS